MFLNQEAESVSVNLHQKRLVMGCDAIAQGALDAGISVATSYPGTPATEVMEYILTKRDQVEIAEWCINEQVALEAAAAASIAGKRALCVMKHYGLNVAADFLAALTLSDCCRGGIVIVVGDDPDGHASRSEQDSRFYARLFDIPLMEPATLDEAYRMCISAFGISEKYALPVILRSTSRFLYSHGVFGFPDAMNSHSQKNCNIDHNLRIFSSPAVKFHDLQRQKSDRLKSDRSITEYTLYEKASHPEYLIICTGRAYPLIKEALSRAGIEEQISLLKLGFGWPICDQMVMEIIKKYSKIMFLEETDAFIEDNIIKTIAQQCNGDFRYSFYGKFNNLLSGQVRPGIGELHLEYIEEQIHRIIKGNADSGKAPLTIAKSLKQSISGKFCPGCPHRSSFFIISQLRQLLPYPLTIFGDIGCYTQAIGPAGFYAMDTAFCMGASVGIGSLFSRLQGANKVLAVIGDSTLFHAALPALVEIKQKKAAVTVVILDNSVSAMTGGQSTPATSAMGDNNGVSIQNVLEGIGLPCATVDPFDYNASIDTLGSAINQDAPACVIFSRPCALFSKANKKNNPEIIIDPERCVGGNCGCKGYCSRVFACPAIPACHDNQKPQIDQAQCVKCSACLSICPQSAITRKGAEDAIS